MFTSNVEAAVRWDRWDLVALVLAVFTALWVFALKLKTFYDLGYSSDLFVMVQAARSWLEGKGVLQDNCFGNLLAIHTIFCFCRSDLWQNRSVPPACYSCLLRR
jgi:hypothetical protein